MVHRPPAIFLTIETLGSGISSRLRGPGSAQQVTIGLQMPHFSHGPLWLELSVQEPGVPAVCTAVPSTVARPPNLQQQLFLRADYLFPQEPMLG